MLLHVIEAPGPIDTSMHRSQVDLPVNNVHDLVSLIAHLQHIGFAKLAKVIRLAAGGRVERRCIEEDFPRRGGLMHDRFAAQHLRAEVAREGIIVVEASRRHRFSTLQRALPRFGVLVALSLIHIWGISTVDPNSAKPKRK